MGKVKCTFICKKLKRGLAIIGDGIQDHFSCINKVSGLDAREIKIQFLSFLPTQGVFCFSKYFLMEVCCPKIINVCASLVRMESVV